MNDDGEDAKLIAAAIIYAALIAQPRGQPLKVLLSLAAEEVVLLARALGRNSDRAREQQAEE